MDRPGLWIILYSVGLVLVFLLFLALTADPAAPGEARAASGRAGDVLAQAAGDAIAAAEAAVRAWSARYGI